MQYEQHIARLCQGGVFRRLVVLERIELLKKEASDDEDELRVIDNELPYAVMLSQDCDLQWDHRLREPGAAKNQDKFLSAMLVCPAYLADRVKAGTHLETKGLKMAEYSGSRWELIKQNSNDRYHYLHSDQTLEIPELVLDFKGYRTVARETLLESLRAGNALGALKPLFRERLSQRFANYLSRIGLPETEMPAPAVAVG